MHWSTRWEPVRAIPIWVDNIIIILYLTLYYNTILCNAYIHVSCCVHIIYSRTSPGHRAGSVSQFSGSPIPWDFVGEYFCIYIYTHTRTVKRIVPVKNNLVYITRIVALVRLLDDNTTGARRRFRRNVPPLIIILRWKQFTSQQFTYTYIYIKKISFSPDDS